MSRPDHGYADAAASWEAERARACAETPDPRSRPGDAVSLRVRALLAPVDALLRLEAEERRLAERMQRDMVRRTALRVRILAARCSLTAEGAREYAMWARVSEDDRRMLKEVLRK